MAGRLRLQHRLQYEIQKIGAGVHVIWYSIPSLNAHPRLAGRLEDELVIPYKIEGSNLLLDDGKFLTQNQVEDGLQGYWTERYTNTFLIVGEHEYNIYFNKGQVTSESASEAAFGNAGEYYYYGPYKGTYEFKFGEFLIKMNDKFADGNEWYFNVVNGDVVAIHDGRVCSRGNGLPGQNGYEF